MSEAQHPILAARFEAPDAAARAAASLRRTFADMIGQTAALYVESGGIAKLVGLKDWGTGRAALLGGLVGIIGGSVDELASSGIGALATKLRDVGFSDRQLDSLGRSLKPSSSALILEISPTGVPRAKQLLASLGAKEIVIEVVDAWIASQVCGDQVTDTSAPLHPSRDSSHRRQDARSRTAS